LASGLTIVLLCLACAAPGASNSPLTTPAQTPPTAPSDHATPVPTDAVTPQPTAQPTATSGELALPTATPKIVGTTFTSSDGRVTVEVPDGAAPAGTEVSIEARGAEQSPPELVSAGVQFAHYGLLPEGTQFSQPVKVTFAIPRDTYGDPNAMPLLYLATRSEDGTWEWLADADMTLTDTSISVSGWAQHFSALFSWSDRTDFIIDPPAPRTDFVGTTFSRTIEARSKDERVHEINFTNVFFYNYSPGVIAVGADASGTPSAPKAIIRRDWTCLSVGDYHVEFWATVNQFAADNPFWDELGLGENVGAAKINLDGKCVAPPLIVVASACFITRHESLESFVSYLEYLMGFVGDVRSVTITMQGANDDEPLELTHNADGTWSGDLGLHNAGPKTITHVEGVTTQGETVDITDQVKQLVGDVVVEYPAELTFGTCPGD
jgi:hypothetical protein